MPDKNKVYNEMEAMIRQFKLVIDGIRPEAGEIYSFTESPNGELGFHIVSDGSKNPYRVRCRPPCFPIFSAVDQISVGFLVSDLVCNVSSLNVIAGELER
jgi:NADH:ubiquinone oxidoreductase subunit D